MDTATIGAALTSIKTVIDLLRTANDAQLAIKISGEIANIQGRLIDVQQQAIALQDENVRLKGETRTLKAGIFADGEPCPKCRQKGWRIVSSAPDPIFGVLGASLRKYECSSCGFTESKQVG
jgi:hypothetical protein